jgi:ribose transport system substrate-binding protein
VPTFGGEKHIASHQCSHDTEDGRQPGSGNDDGDDDADQNTHPDKRGPEVIGALKALREAGRASPKQFLGGIDGEPDAVAELKDQQSPYKASVSLASPVFGFALGSFAADWQDGKSVPQAMDILPKLLTAENIAQYEADLQDPASVFADHRRREVYLKMYGNICFETRNEYLNFPWSSDH